MKVYTEPEIYQLIDDELRGWEYSDEGKLTATYEFKDFVEALSFVNDMAELAEELEHHPEILIQYNVVNLSLVTHDEDNQVTELDVTLAKAIENLVL